MNSISSGSYESPNYSENHDYVFKFVIIGDSGVGKSCVMHHFMFNKYKKETTQTIGVEFCSKIINQANKDIKLQLWDTAGQEKFRSIVKSYYRGAIGVVIIYDITNIESFQNVVSWLNDAKNLARSECSICLVGNKSDLSNDRKIDYIDGAKFCQENNLIHFECSALTGENIDEIFTTISKHIINKIDNGIIEPSSVASCGYNYKQAKEKIYKNKEIGNNGSSCSNNC